MSDVWITPRNTGKALGFALLGNAKPSTYSSGGSPWTVIDRPRRKPFTEFNAVQLTQLELPLMLDKADTEHSVEAECATVDSWRYVDAASRHPTRLGVSGPVSLNGIDLWVLIGLSWGDEIRRTRDGHRIQQAVTITLLEFAGNTATYLSPAILAQARQTLNSTLPPPGGHRTYYVKPGDTLSGVAASQLGDYRRWPEIAALNGIRDPRYLQANTVIQLP